MDLLKFYDKYVKIEDYEGNVIEGYVFDYDSGDEEDEDSKYFNVPNITVEHINVINGTYYCKGDLALFYEEDIKNIEIIK